MILTLNDKSATKIAAKRVRETANSIYLNCEGDYLWLPKQFIKYDNNDKTVIIEDWLYTKTFED